MSSSTALRFDTGRLARIGKHLGAYVDSGRLAGWQLALTGREGVFHEASFGWRDREAGEAVRPDTVWRIASMTKPVTCVAAMTLWEEGAFELTDPISKWIPAFEHARVYVKGSDVAPVTVPVSEPIRVWHLLTHTSGLTAGFLRTSVVDAIYRAAGYEFAAPPGRTDIAGCVEDWAALPLLFEPGSAWGYGVSTDVLGRLIEIWSGEPLDAAIARRVTQPLGMTDTIWWCDDSRLDRLATLYFAGADGSAERHPANDLPNEKPGILSGGGGLLSTVADYVRFTRMLLNDGELDGVRVLAPRTVKMMATNQLHADLGELSTGGFAETSFDGVGFGFGMAVLVDPQKSKSAGSVGEFYWGGIYSTAFWVDPVEEIGCVFMSQLMPSSTYPIRSQLRQLVYSALIR